MIIRKESVRSMRKRGTVIFGLVGAVAGYLGKSYMDSKADEAKNKKIDKFKGIIIF